MDKANDKDKGTDGPGIKWNKSVGDYKRGLGTVTPSAVESEDRKGAGQKA